ncbi:MAG TPA: hypothetical protein VE715_23025 [Blastocatellia bacterium]|nr:hypothetical protein [Blastocatellia bacterium]
MNEIGEIDEYWTRRVEIGRLPLPIEGDQAASLIWHQVQENCGRGHREIGLGVMKDNTDRVYVHAKACYFTPEIAVTICVTAPNARPGEQVGVVEDVQRRGSIRREFANLQAWFYPGERALMLWEVDLWRGREENPTQDFLLACLFDGFERELLRIFPDVRQVITPHEPNYPSEQWAASLNFAF